MISLPDLQYITSFIEKTKTLVFLVAIVNGCGVIVEPVAGCHGAGGGGGGYRDVGNVLYGHYLASIFIGHYIVW